MSLYCKNDNYTLYCGMMQDELSNLAENSIDSIVTDPPYELGFMGKTWDSSGVAFQKETWEKCLRVLKPGGYLLAFGGSRTYHRIACAIEDAGFEIRDTIMWLYGSGFPKSLNIGLALDKKMGNEREKIGEIRIGKTSLGDASGWDTSENMRKLKSTGKIDVTKGNSKWEGWGTALKPAFEPIIVARKPFDGSLVDNVLEWGVGGLNIDECRVGDDYISGGTAPDLRDVGRKQKEISGIDKLSFGQVRNAERVEYEGHFGRFPANIITDGSDEVCCGFPNSGSGNGGDVYSYSGREYHNKNTSMFNGDKPQSPSNYNDIGSASRYFYCAKASKKDRDEGLECFSQQKVGDGRNVPADNPFQRGETLRHNIHPTVKPTDLMQYLVRLVSPKGSTILDPFMGSGSTGKACMIENQERNAGYKFIGIEMTDEYLPIADARIGYWVDTKVEYSDKSFKPEEKNVKEEVVNLWG